MKILHVESGMHLYGGALQVVFLMRELSAKGIQCFLACPQGSAIADAAAAYASVHPMPMKGDADIGMVRRLRRLMMQVNPDVVHLHSRRGADIWGGIAARSCSLPVVLSRRVDNPEARWVASLKYRLYDRTVTISDGIRQVLLNEGVAADRIRCVPSAVDTSQYHPEDRDDAWFRREFALAPDELVVGMSAQLIPRKGHQLLLEALPEVLKVHPRLKVLMFGRGPEADRIQSAIDASPLMRPHVCMTGFRTDLDRVLKHLDLLVHPAYMEGLGVSLLQAAACGVPIVAARAGGMPEIVHPGVNGELITPGDVKGLSEAMNKVLGSQELRRRYGLAGRQLVADRFSIEAMVCGNLAVYRELTG